ncbi:NADP-dependent oxidoreductase domain-containing protein [Aspergillus karnatakaensis]|uniref:NADP-dependent oxidoreductase domain-containing protein n=1 Tax=Aspergillus karnatakaensis TaxID=1810916 RepID=UPI003CCE4410
MSSTAQIVFGGNPFQNEFFGDLEMKRQALEALHAEGVKEIDTASGYAASEANLGKLHAAELFTLHSKFTGDDPETPTEEKIIATALESLKKTGADQFGIYYIHAPDPRIPFKTLISAIHTLHQTGIINRFGLANFLPAQVEEVIRIANENNWIKPTVYQGPYSAITRRAETELFPILRRHGIAFYAYSPIAGGFLAKDPANLDPKDGGRWDASTWVGSIYHLLFNKPRMLQGLQVWGGIANDAGVGKAELACRWILFHSALRREAGDRIIIGANNVEQLRETLGFVGKGPLGVDWVERIERVWGTVQQDAPFDAFHDGILKWGR